MRPDKLFKMAKKPIIEICCYSLADCTAAQMGGADRAELCANPLEGGTTPSYGILKMARNLLAMQVRAIVRPRGGDFVYSDIEFLTMQADILQCKELDMDGVVTGILTKNGEIDAKRMQILIELAHPLPVTFHRAIDMTNDPVSSIEQLISLGCTSILSSGAANSALEGIGNLKKWQIQFSGQIEIIAGGGINPENIAQIAQHTNLRAYHTSLRKPFIASSGQFGHYEPILSSDVKKLKFALHQSLLE